MTWVILNLLRFRFLAQDMACSSKCSLCAPKAIWILLCCMGIYFLKCKVGLNSRESCFKHSCSSWFFFYFFLSVIEWMKHLNNWLKSWICHFSWRFNLCILKIFLNVPLFEDYCVLKPWVLITWHTALPLIYSSFLCYQFCMLLEPLQVSFDQLSVFFHPLSFKFISDIFLMLSSLWTISFALLTNLTNLCLLLGVFRHLHLMWLLI